VLGEEVDLKVGKRERKGKGEKGVGDKVGWLQRGKEARKGGWEEGRGERGREEGRRKLLPPRTYPT